MPVLGTVAGAWCHRAGNARWHASAGTAWYVLARAGQVRRGDVAAWCLLILALQDVPLAKDILSRYAGA